MASYDFIVKLRRPHLKVIFEVYHSHTEQGLNPIIHSMVLYHKPLLELYIIISCWVIESLFMKLPTKNFPKNGFLRKMAHMGRPLVERG